MLLHPRHCSIPTQYSHYWGSCIQNIAASRDHFNREWHTWKQFDSGHLRSDRICHISIQALSQGWSSVASVASLCHPATAGCSKNNGTESVQHAADMWHCAALQWVMQSMVTPLRHVSDVWRCSDLQREGYSSWLLWVLNSPFETL